MPQIGEKCKRERENKTHRRADRVVRPYTKQGDLNKHGRAGQSPAPTHLFPHPTQKRGGRVATSYKFSVAGEKLFLQLTHQGDMQLVSSCFCTPHKMTGHFVGAPGTNFNPRRK